jgi:hypothetical protein
MSWHDATPDHHRIVGWQFDGSSADMQGTRFCG